jgi:hypothetical protein
MTKNATRSASAAEAADAQTLRPVDPQRRTYLQEALMAHLGPEAEGRVPGIVDSYASGGHLNFNGFLYETPEALEAFHRKMGFGGNGMLADIVADIAHVHYTFSIVIVEFTMRATVTVALAGAAPGRPVAFNACGIYCFDDNGKLASERIYLDTGNLLPEPIVRP